MLNKKNILEIIQDHQDEIDQLEYELEQVRQSDMTESTKAINNKLSYLKDNQYRYKLQAKVWGLIEKVEE